MYPACMAQPKAKSAYGTLQVQLGCFLGWHSLSGELSLYIKVELPYFGA